MLENKRNGLSFDAFKQKFEANLLDKAYDKFSVSLQNMELMMALKVWATFFRAFYRLQSI